MRRFLLIFTVFSISAWAQLAQQQAQPPIVDDVKQHQKSTAEAADDMSKNDKQDRVDRWTFDLTVANTCFTGLLVLIGFGGVYAAIRTLKEMRTSTVVSEKALILAQRPRITVRAFYFTEMKGVGGIYKVNNGVTPGSFCNGQFYIQNLGGTDARIKDIWSEVCIEETLPMKRPYEGLEGSKDEKTLKPGQSSFYLFGLKNSPGLDAQTANDVTQSVRNLYILGWIGYTDDLGIYRITGFCRCYDVGKDRFVPVDDPDYEYSD